MFRVRCDPPGLRVLLTLLVSLTSPALLGAQNDGAAGVRLDGVIGAGEYAHNRRLADGRFLLAWDVSGDRIAIGMSAETGGWVGLAIEPIVVLDNADLLIGWVEDGEVRTVDGQALGPYGPLAADTELGGTDDILQAAGRQEGGRTTIELIRALDTSDPHDRPIEPGRPGTRVVWLYGDTNRWRDGWTEMGTVQLRTERERPVILYVLLLTAAFLIIGAAVLASTRLRRYFARPGLGRGLIVAVLGLLLAALVLALIRAGLL